MILAGLRAWISRTLNRPEWQEKSADDCSDISMSLVSRRGTAP